MRSSDQARPGFDAETFLALPLEEQFIATRKISAQIEARSQDIDLASPLRLAGSREPFGAPTRSP